MKTFLLLGLLLGSSLSAVAAENFRVEIELLRKPLSPVKCVLERKSDRCLLTYKTNISKISNQKCHDISEKIEKLNPASQVSEYSTSHNRYLKVKVQSKSKNWTRVVSALGFRMCDRMGRCKNPEANPVRELASTVTSLVGKEGRVDRH